MREKNNSQIWLYLASCILHLCFLFLFPTLGFASPAKNVKEGNVLYEKGDYAGAFEKYQQAVEKDSESDIINFDLGTALYKQGEYQRAIYRLQKSLLSEDKILKEKGHYNLGNALYKLGASQENDKIENAISLLEDATTQYDNALKIDPQDEDAKSNYDFVLEEIERLKVKQQQQKQQQGQKQNKQSQEDQQEDKEGQENKSQQDQSSQQEKKEQEENSPQSQESQDGEKQQEQESGQQESEQEESQKSQGEEGSENEGDKEQGSESAEEQSSDSKEGQSPEIIEGLTEKEAQMLLNGYQQSEEPKGLLNFYRRKGKAQRVLKDW